MAQTSNTNEFIEKARLIHGDKYDYSKVEYINSFVKIKIICPEHGEFYQTPHNHLKKYGCSRCGRMSSINSRFSSTEKFIEKARIIHGDKYDYSKVEYVHNKRKIVIVCKIHGEFSQTPNCHLKGQGCPICGKDELVNGLYLTLEEFINKSRLIHGDKYDYSKVEYVGNKSPIIIICPTHGEYFQKPYHHLRGQGCMRCGISSCHMIILNISKDYNVDINNRMILDGKELDVFIEGVKKAIKMLS